MLEEGEIRRLGGREAKKIDVRVLAATGKPMEQAVEQGEFRSDLYYRLNVVRLHIPPLRDRPEDIPELLTHFARQVAQRLGHPVSVTPAALVRPHPPQWPGNVREAPECGRACGGAVRRLVSRQQGLRSRHGRNLDGSDGAALRAAGPQVPGRSGRTGRAFSGHSRRPKEIAGRQRIFWDQPAHALLQAAGDCQPREFLTHSAPGLRNHGLLLRE